MAQNEKKVGKTRTRATTSEVCERHKKQRSHLYYERRKIKKALEKGGLTDRKLGILFKREDRVNSRIERLNHKIFKCSKEYSNLKKKRRNLLRDIKNLREELTGYKNLDRETRESKFFKLKSLNEEYRLLGERMSLPKKRKTSIKRSFGTLDNGVDYKVQAVWRAEKDVSSILEGGLIKTVDINGVLYDVKDDAVDLRFRLSEMIDEVTSTQETSQLETPMVNIMVDVENGKMTIEYLW